MTRRVRRRRVAAGSTAPCSPTTSATDGWELRLLSFDYGQRHAMELDHARQLAAALGAPPRRRRPALGRRACSSGSALTDAAVDVPDGHYTDESMRATVVANRNAIFVQVAVGVAVAEGADAVAVGIHAGDHPIYPDCRPAFVDAAEHLARVANEGFVADGFQRAGAVPARGRRPTSCAAAPSSACRSPTRGPATRAAPSHCGTCGTCVERREAFELAGVADPTKYEVGLMYRVSKRFGFSASHVLHGLGDDHPCSRLHGHNYESRCSSSATTSTSAASSSTSRELDPVKRWIDATLDHRHLNDVMEGQPSAEAIARLVHEWCARGAARSTSPPSGVWETPRAYAEYRP